MVELLTRIRRFGNSWGIPVPSKLVGQGLLKPGEEVRVLVLPRDAAKKVFGIGKGSWKPGDAQRVKDELRKEW